MPAVYQISKTENRPSLSVVFIHGSGGDYLSTWTPTGQDRCLMHWLGEDLKDADVLSVAHEANAKSFSDYSTLAEYACAIAYGLGPMIRGRSVLFVCHSLGGLIAKQIAVTVRGNDLSWMKEADFCFVGTPHSGVRFRWLRRAHMLIFRNQLGRLLLGDNATLKNLNYDFLRVSGGKIVCFAERRRWCLLKLMSDRSGLIEDSRVVNIPVSKTHSELCKPTGRDDILYQAILRLCLDKLNRVGLIGDSNFVNNRLIGEALESLRDLKEAEQNTSDQNLISQYLEGLRKSSM